MLKFENRLPIRYTCSKSTMESKNLDKKESHITSKTTEALKEQGTF